MTGDPTSSDAQRSKDGDGNGHEATAIDAVLSDAFPDQSPSVLVDWSSRDPNGVYLVEAGGKEFVCKLARDGGWRRFAREVAATDLAHEVGLGPEVVTASTGKDHASDDPGPHHPPYFVTRRLPGSTPADAWGDLPADADPGGFRRLGAALARLHDRTEREDCGRIVGGRGGDLELSPQSDWHAVLLDLTRRRVTDLDGTRFETVAADVLACVGRHPEVRRGARPALVHNDPGIYNVCVADRAVTGLIDWELAFCGDGVYDLVFVEDALRDGPADLEDTESAVEALYDGYRDRRPERSNFELRRAVYRLVRSLRPLRTFDSWGPSLAADRETTVEDLADRLRESVRDRIAAVEDADGDCRRAGEVKSE